MEKHFQAQGVQPRRSATEAGYSGDGYPDNPLLDSSRDLARLRFELSLFENLEGIPEIPQSGFTDDFRGIVLGLPLLQFLRLPMIPHLGCRTAVETAELRGEEGRRNDRPGTYLRRHRRDMKAPVNPS